MKHSRALSVTTLALLSALFAGCSADSSSPAGAAELASEDTQKPSDSKESREATFEGEANPMTVRPLTPGPLGNLPQEARPGAPVPTPRPQASTPQESRPEATAAKPRQKASPSQAPQPARSAAPSRPQARPSPAPRTGATAAAPRPKAMRRPAPRPRAPGAAPRRHAKPPQAAGPPAPMGAGMGAGMGMIAPPFAVPVRARHRQGQAPEIEVERQKDLGGDFFALKADGKVAALIVNGVDYYDLNQTQITALNNDRNIWVAVDEELAGQQVSVEAYVPMVDAKRRRTGIAQFSAQIQIPNAPKIVKTPKPKTKALDTVRPAGTTIEIEKKK